MDWTDQFAYRLISQKTQCVMQSSHPIECPFCGECYELVIDTTVESQTLITDCEICCRPCQVRIECEMGDVVSASVES